MAKYLRHFRCADCGVPASRVLRSMDPRVCVACGIARSVAYNRAMLARSGPAWEAHQRNPGGRPKRSTPRE